MKKEQAQTKIDEEKVKLYKTEQQVNAILTAQGIVQTLAKQSQQSAHKQVAKIVSKSLSAVFEEPYELRIDFVEKRGRTEADFLYLRGGRKVGPKVTSGGVRQVASLALRIVNLLLSSPSPRRFLALDEPFLGLDATNLPKMAALLTTLAKDLQMQFLIVSHSDALRIGKVYEIG